MLTHYKPIGLPFKPFGILSVHSLLLMNAIPLIEVTEISKLTPMHCEQAYRDFYGVEPVLDENNFPELYKIYREFREAVFAYVLQMRHFPPSHDAVAALSSSQRHRDRAFNKENAERAWQTYQCAISTFS